MVELRKQDFEEGIIPNHLGYFKTALGTTYGGRGVKMVYNAFVKCFDADKARGDFFRSPTVWTKNKGTFDLFYTGKDSGSKTLTALEEETLLGEWHEGEEVLAANALLKASLPKPASKTKTKPSAKNKRNEPPIDEGYKRFKAAIEWVGGASAGAPKHPYEGLAKAVGEHFATMGDLWGDIKAQQEALFEERAAFQKEKAEFEEEKESAKAALKKKMMAAIELA